MKDLSFQINDGKEMGFQNVVEKLTSLVFEKMEIAWMYNGNQN